MNTKTFDAVIESRKWKEAVARETQDMNRAEVLAYFDPDAVRRKFEAVLEHSTKFDNGETLSESSESPCIRAAD